MSTTTAFSLVHITWGIGKRVLGKTKPGRSLRMRGGGGGVNHAGVCRREGGRGPGGGQLFPLKEAFNLMFKSLKRFFLGLLFTKQ